MAHLDPVLANSSQQGVATLAYGLTNDEHIVHISSVPSGLACSCFCPACHCPLVAKHCHEKVDHFAHYHAEECAHAHETALHLLAKQILETVLTLDLPQWDASDGVRNYTIQRVRSYAFDSAALEYRIDRLIPDVLVRKADRTLLVEFYVTHRCGEDKVSKIKALGVSALEIDLSALAHDASIEDVKEAVLHSAPRWWLVNARLAAKQVKIIEAWDEIDRQKREQAELEWKRSEERIARKVFAKNRQMERTADTIIKALSKKEAHPFPLTPPTRAMRSVEGLHMAQYINIPLKGDRAFAVCPSVWQAMILNNFILNASQRSSSEISTKWVFNCVRKAGYIEPSCCGFIDVQIEHFVREVHKEFCSPYAVIRAYLRYLSDKGLLFRSGNRWRPTDASQPRRQG